MKLRPHSEVWREVFWDTFVPGMIFVAVIGIVLGLLQHFL